MVKDDKIISFELYESFKTLLLEVGYSVNSREHKR